MAGTLRRRSVWILAAVIAVVLTAGVVGRRMHEDHGVRVGDRFDTVTVFSGQATSTARISVPIAFGSLSVTLGAATEIGERDHRVEAPGGATLMEVSWSPVASYVTPAVWPTASARQRRDPGANSPWSPVVVGIPSRMP